MFITVENC